MDRAKSPVYYTIGDTKIGYVAASRVVYAMDWYATDDRPGMIGTYDPALFISSIEEAKKNSDFVVAYVHWGVERSHEPVDYQRIWQKSNRCRGRSCNRLSSPRYARARPIKEKQLPIALATTGLILKKRSD